MKKSIIKTRSATLKQEVSNSLSYHEEVLKNYDLAVHLFEKQITIKDEELCKRILLTLTKIERKKMSERTKAGIYYARRRGCYTSRAPLGYDNTTINFNSTLKINDKSILVQRAYKMLATENKSLKDIKEFFKSRGLIRSYSDLEKIISNRVYLGEIFVPAFNDQFEKYVIGLHEQLISEDLFIKANEFLKKTGNKQF